MSIAQQADGTSYSENGCVDPFLWRWTYNCWSRWTYESLPHQKCSVVETLENRKLVEYFDKPRSSFISDYVNLDPYDDENLITAPHVQSYNEHSSEHRIEKLPLVDEGRLSGLITIESLEKVNFKCMNEFGLIRLEWSRYWMQFERAEALFEA